MACKYETSNGRCGLKGCYAYRHKCYTEDMCKCNEPPTNADRIRYMSDAELAQELALIAEWDRQELEKAKRVPGLVQFMFDWLLEPAKEG